MKLFKKSYSKAYRKHEYEVKLMKLNKILALLLALVMVFSFAACDKGGSESQSSGESQSGGEQLSSGGKVVKSHLTAALESIDPKRTSAGDDFEVIGTMIEGLFKVDASGAAVPGIAETHEVSPDGLTWTFHLREAYWSNGAKVTADDFVFGWDRCVDENDPAQYASLFETAGIESYEAVDEATFVVKLKLPCAFFDSLMFFPVFYPVNREFAEECGDLYGSAPQYYISNGPFVLSDYEPAAMSFSVRKNDKYYDADKIQIDGIDYKVILDSQSAYLAYQNNELDICKLSSELAEILKSDPEFHSVMTGYLWYLSPNVSGGKGLENANIRKAIGMAFDKDAIANNILKNGSVVADWCVPQGLATGPDGKDYRETSDININVYDVAKAQEYWKKGLEELGVSSLSYTIIFDDDGTSNNVVAFIAEQLMQNLEGLSIELKVLPKKERSDLMKAHTYDIGFCRWGPDYADPLTYFDLWTDGYTHNYGNWHSDEYMDLLNNIKFGELAVDASARWEAFKEAEQMIADEAVILPVYQACDACLIKSNVSGVEFHSVGLNRVYNNVIIG